MSTRRVSHCLSRYFDVLVWLLLGVIVSVCVSSTESTRRNQVRFSDDVIVFPNEETFVGKEKRSEHEEYERPGIFRHDREFHKGYPQFPGRRMGHNNVEHNPEFHKVQGDERNFYKNLKFRNDTDAIPLDLIREINEIDDMNEFIRKYVQGGEEMNHDATLLIDRFGTGERNAAIRPKPAGCVPELQTVKLATSSDASILYMPQCTRIERCGGCCIHNLLSCQPIETEPVSFSVNRIHYTGGRNFKFIDKEIVVLEKHTKCKCGCKVRPEDCNRFQVHNSAECRCTCVNSDEEKKCNKENQTKLWDPQLCTCTCREVKPCSTGSEFDSIECKCVPVPMRNRYIDAEPRIDDEK